MGLTADRLVCNWKDRDGEPCGESVRDGSAAADDWTVTNNAEEVRRGWAPRS
jgi:hypothetical protein